MDEIKKDEIIKFIQGYEQEEGGFSFARTTPATLDDTYFAIKTFQELNYPYYNIKTKKYVNKISPNSVKDSKLLYKLIWLKKYFRINVNDINNAFHIQSKNLDGAYYLMKINKLLGSKIFLDYNAKRYNNKPPKYVSDVLKLAYLFNELKEEFNKVAYVRYLQDCQNSDGGFGFHPGTTSFLGNTYYSLRALTILHARPKEIEKCKQFIVACKIKAGGFGRQIMTVPTIESTYYAIKSLKLLKMMKKANTPDSKNKIRSYKLIER